MTEERRLVTILFADVVGSTALGEALDPEDVRALLGRLFAIARDAVEEHGGRVEKFIGDAVMAVFGLPIAHDDDPARALGAALALRDRVRADPALGDRLPIRLGVNSGEVIASRDPLQTEFMVTGDAVNTAARLQQAGDAWMILVGERTVRAVHDAFIFGSQIGIEAKGKAVPIGARPLIGRSTSLRVVRRRGRLVGRNADLLQLQLVARRAIDEARPYLVSVVAPAGVGKSRLIEEFVDRLADTTPARVAIAQCLPYGQRLTYWPMRAILLSILGLGDDTTPDLLRERLGEWLATRGEPDTERTADLVAATVGAGDLDTADRISLFGAWRRFVELAAEESPLVLIIEDLHWSSDSLLDLIEAILQPRADVPLLMVALARPELLDRRPSWGGGRRNAVFIALEPLRDQAVEQLVASLLDDPSPEILSAVVQRAEGNPFYAGEIVRSLIDRLGASPDPQQIQPAIAALPDTVQTTVLARLDALEATPRRVIQLGSVLGRSFQPAAISALEPDLVPDVVAAGVEALIERDLVRPAGPETVTFRHILFREVAYGTLPRSERVRLHAAAGRWLEERATDGGRADELAELVAFHFREAATLGSMIGEGAMSDVASRAVKWLRRAADVAGSGAASVEAARHLQAAIELAPPEASAELYEALGQAWITGDQAVQAYEQAHELGGRFGLGIDQQLRTRAQRLIVETRWIGSVKSRYEDEDLRQFVHELEAMDAVASEDRARAAGLLARGFLATSMASPTAADLEAAEQPAEQALEIGARLRDVDLQSAALDALWAIGMADDRASDGLQHVRRRLELQGLGTAERLDAMIVSAWSNVLLGNLHDAERAAAQVREGLAAGQAAGYVMGASGWRTEALWMLGRWDEALAEATRSETAWHESEIHAPGFSTNGFLAALSICQARRDTLGADHWRSVVETILARTDVGIRIHFMRGFLSNDYDSLVREVVVNYRVFFGRLDYVQRATERLTDRRHPIPEPALRSIVAYAQERGLRVLLTHSRRALGVLWNDDAELRRALQAYEAMEARPFVARVKTELALRTRDPGLLEAGVTELEALGDVDQLERVLSESRTTTAAWTARS